MSYISDEQPQPECCISVANGFVYGNHEQIKAVQALILEVEELRMKKAAEQTDVGTRKCTCHPDDKPPTPCPEKYAFSECVAAMQPPAVDDGELLKKVIKTIDYCQAVVNPFTFSSAHIAKAVIEAIHSYLNTTRQGVQSSE